MKQILRITFLFFLAFMLCVKANAQEPIKDQEQLAGNYSDPSGLSGYEFVGQSFTAGITGKLKKIRLRLAGFGSNGSVKYTLRIVAVNGSGVPLPGTILASTTQTFSVTLWGTDCDLVFDSPATVEKDKKYAFLLSTEDENGQYFFGANPYAKGNMYTKTKTGNIIEQITWDFYFVTYVIPAPLHVDAAVSTSGNGGAWATAYKTLKEALDFATANTYIDSIKVAAGTYYPTGSQSGTDRDATFAITRGGIKILGGYNAVTGLRNRGTNPTTLSGDIGTPNNNADNSYHVMVIAGIAANADSVIVDGFNITGGNANVDSEYPINGVNVNSQRGGGINISSNSNNSKIAIRSCVVFNNDGIYGGGMSVLQAFSTVVNCLFVNNTANRGGGTWVDRTATFVNCTWYGNITSGGGTGEEAVYISTADEVKIRNCAVRGYITRVRGITSIEYSIFPLTHYTGVGNIIGDPLFVNEADPIGPDGIWGTADDGLRLPANSPARNAGNNAEIPIGITTDIAGAKRVQHTMVDMGAYEYQPITTLHVNAAVAASGDGSTWSTAYKTLKEALDIANNDSHVDSIRVATGTYYPTGTQNGTDRDATFAVTRSNLKILGGYNTTTGIRDGKMNATILSGDIGTTGNNSDNSYHVMVLANIPITDSLVIDGFTITGGNADGSGFEQYNGKGIYRNRGAGLYGRTVGSNTAISNCVFTGNGTSGNGGGMYNDDGASPTIHNSVFSNNTAQTGGGLYNDGSSPQLANVVFNGNAATVNGGGMYNSDSSPGIVNSSFAGNTATANGNSLYSHNGNTTIVNSILWSANASTNIYGTASLSVSHSNIQQSSGVLNGTGNLNVDPKFADVGNAAGADGLWGTADDGLKLKNGSPSLNSGNNTALPAEITKDITGTNRIQQTTVDMGAYEGGVSTALYVNAAIAASGDGKIWSTAYKTLNEALNVANTSPVIDSIKVARGTYYPTGTRNGTDRDATFAITRSNLKILGGYNAATGTRNSKMNTTILSGDIGTANNNSDNSYHVMVLANIPVTDSLVIDGFTIMNGNADGSGSREYGTKHIHRNRGGGLYAHTIERNTLISNCVFSGNGTSGTGGGMYVGSSTIIHCVFANNTSGNNGGGMHNDGASPLIINCVFANNTASNNGGGLYNSDALSEMVGTTFSNNIATANGNSIYNYRGTNTVSNSILRSADAAKNVYVSAGGLGISHSNVQQGSGVFSGTGNINANPLFVNAGNVAGADGIFGTADDGLRLGSNSPALNVGSNTAIPVAITKDITGADRIQQTTVDMGAYEGEVNTPSLTKDQEQLFVFIHDDWKFGVYNLVGQTFTAGISGKLRKITLKLGKSDGIGNVEYTLKIVPVDGSGEPLINTQLASNTQTFNLSSTSIDCDFVFDSPYSIEKNKKYAFILSSVNTTQAKFGIMAADRSSGEPDPYSGGMMYARSLGDFMFAMDHAMNYFDFYFITYVEEETTLPVTLTSFTAKKINNTVLLQWQTASEQNNKGFEVYRSGNDKQFVKIGEVAASQISHLPSHIYNYTDKSPLNGNNYYQLVQIDNDGKTTELGIRQINFGLPTSDIRLYPNPVKTHFYLTVSQTGEELRIYDAMGRQVFGQLITQHENNISFSGFAPGVYVYQYGRQRGKFIKE